MRLFSRACSFSLMRLLLVFRIFEHRHSDDATRVDAVLQRPQHPVSKLERILRCGARLVAPREPAAMAANAVVATDFVNHGGSLQLLYVRPCLAVQYTPGRGVCHDVVDCDYPEIFDNLFPILRIILAMPDCVNPYSFASCF